MQHGSHAASPGLSSRSLLHKIRHVLGHDVEVLEADVQGLGRVVVLLILPRWVHIVTLLLRTDFAPGLRIALLALLATLLLVSLCGLFGWCGQRLTSKPDLGVGRLMRPVLTDKHVGRGVELPPLSVWSG